ncbi:hypothetical protein VII00023_07039 [Vibrio ichthyoenteri ATCC 700023]|uniref:Uncharacterized protein n=1 Tax=Vibrio ichthyoenteri ATCC 700023 TaxID=870968 RepID=F9S3U7_9VIBR|nr:hypothetical protein VII00023_07039 [Vibrio ichthyoenteri ATCC 700023]
MFKIISIEVKIKPVVPSDLTLVFLTKKTSKHQVGITFLSK